jgi:hypothetical protein
MLTRPPAVLATLASFIFVSFLFVAYGTLQRRRHAQALAAAGLPPNWSAFAAWHAERRAARAARELGPRPVLFDVTAGGLSTPGWVAMVVSTSTRASVNMIIDGRGTAVGGNGPNKGDAAANGLAIRYDRPACNAWALLVDALSSRTAAIAAAAACR